MKKTTTTEKEKQIADIKAAHAERMQVNAVHAGLQIPALISMLATYEAKMKEEGANIEDLMAKKKKTEEKLSRFQEAVKTAAKKVKK